MAKNKELIFQISEEYEENHKPIMVDGEEDEVQLTGFEKQQFQEMKQEFFAETGDGSVLQIRAVSETGSETEISMSEAQQLSNFDTLDHVAFGDVGIRKLSTNFDPERSDKLKAQIEEVKTTAYKEALGELANDPKQIDDLDLALNHYYQIVRDRGFRLVKEFDEYVDRCSADVLVEEVPRVIIEISADPMKIKYNPRSEFMKVREFLKAMYQMTYGSFELEHYIENQQQLMDLATFSQDAGMSVHDFLSTEMDFKAIETKIRHNLNMRDEDLITSFNKDVYKKLVTYITLNEAYLDLADVCNHIDRLIDNLTVDELRSYVDDCYENMQAISMEQATKWQEYTNVNGAKIMRLDPADQIEKLVNNSKYDSDAYMEKYRAHSAETIEKLEFVFEIYRPLFKLSKGDNIKKIVNTLRTDISIGLFTADTFDAEKAKFSVEVKRKQMLHEVEFSNEYIQFLPKVMDLSFIREASASLKEKHGFIAKTKRIEQLEERALMALKEIKKMNMKIAIAGINDSNAKSSVKVVYVDIKERMTSVYTDASRFFMGEANETRRIPKFDMRILTAVYLIMLQRLLEQLCDPFIKLQKSEEWDKRTLQLKFKILESKIVEITSFFAFSQMVERDTVYELFVIMADYADAFDFREKDIKLLEVQSILAEEEDRLAKNKK